MGIDHDLGFPAYFGNVVPPAGETEKAADMIGQGKVLASPMVMATVIASIQAGTLVVPSLVTSVTSPAPEGIQGPGPAEAEALRSMLRGVVTGGSGSFLLDVPGPPVIAKTGTAEYVADGGGLPNARLDDCRAGRPRRRRLRRGRCLRFAHRRPDPRAVLAGGLTLREPHRVGTGHPVYGVTRRNTGRLLADTTPYRSLASMFRATSSGMGS